MTNQPSKDPGAIQGDGDSAKGGAAAAPPLLILKQLNKRFGAYPCA